MDKKLMSMVTSLAVGGTLLFGATYVNASQVTGYEAYKNAIKNTVSLKNETANLKVSVADNGNKLVDLSSNMKLNLAADAMSSVTSVQLGDETKTFGNYLQEGKSITKDGDSNEYLVRENRHKDLNEISKTGNSTVQKSVEVIIDTLVGSMQNKVVATDNAGGTKITIDLNENEVTPLVNALTSIAFAQDGHKNFRDVRNEKADVGDLNERIPQLQGDVKVKAVTATIDVNKDDIITKQVAKIVVSGQDDQGKQHEIALTVDLGLSDINTTTADQVDLTGKNVKNVSFDHGEER